MRIPRSAYFCAFLSALALIALSVLGSAAVRASSALTASPSVPRAVALTDARRPPSFLRLVRPGRERTPRRALRDARDGFPCNDAYFSDVSAYRWNGRALSAQRWDRRERMAYWETRSGERVGYDGLTFYNGTRAPVLVAGWCE